MKVTQDGRDLIRKWEGLRLEAYLCSAGKWTIGIGSTFYLDGRPVKKGDTITEKEAQALLDGKIMMFSKRLRALLKVELNECQFSALLSLAFNIGIGRLTTSTVLARINANPDMPEIDEAWMRFNKERKGGRLVENKGLANRRRAELELYRRSC